MEGGYLGRDIETRWPIQSQLLTRILRMLSQAARDYCLAAAGELPDVLSGKPLCPRARPGALRLRATRAPRCLRGT